MGGINNAGLCPKWVPDEQVTMEGWHPDWIKSTIMAQLRVESATDEGTFKAAVRVLDHYREVGVNALWLTPIYDKGVTGNGYSNIGPHSVNPALTGCATYEESWEEVRRFVDEAHKRDIRIYLDVIVWGTVKESPLVTEHPDWYRGYLDVWDGYKWNWYNEELREWFANQVIRITEQTGVDGFRVDLEPFETGYSLFRDIRRRLLERGRKISVFAECTSERGEAYDFDEQITNEDPERWHMHTMFTERLNIVDAIKKGWGHGSIWAQDNDLGGKARFYCLCLSCHDNQQPCLCGDRIRIGYQAIFAPYIPLWFIGDDWNNPKTVPGGLFVNYINWELRDDPAHRPFLEAVKQMIRVRRSYPDLFEYFPENHRESNICKVDADCSLQAYARYANGRAAVVLTNTSDKEETFTANIPFVETGLPAAVAATELLHGAAVTLQGDTLRVSVPAGDVAVVLLEGK